MKSIRSITAAFLTAILLLSLLVSCTDPGADFRGQAPVKPVVKRPINEYGLTLSLPPSCPVQESRGPDYMHYAFLPGSKGEVRGRSGVYFCGPPMLLEWKREGCTEHKIRAELLGRKAEWTVYSCADSVWAEAYTPLKTHENVHAYIRTGTVPEAEEWIRILQTMEETTR